MSLRALRKQMQTELERTSADGLTDVQDVRPSALGGDQRRARTAWLMLGEWGRDESGAGQAVAATVALIDRALDTYDVEEQRRLERERERRELLSRLPRAPPGASTAPATPATPATAAAQST